MRSRHVLVLSNHRLLAAFVVLVLVAMVLLAVDVSAADAGGPPWGEKDPFPKI